MVAVLLAILFGGFLWIHQRTRTEIDVVRSAGRRLWAPALEGCEEGAPAPARSWIGAYRSTQRDVAPAAADRLEDVRVIDATTREIRQTSRPELLGGGLVEVRTSAGTACNPRLRAGEIAWQQRVVELFCERYPLPPNWPEGCAASASSE